MNNMNPVYITMKNRAFNTLVERKSINVSWYDFLHPEYFDCVIDELINKGVYSWCVYLCKDGVFHEVVKCRLDIVKRHGGYDFHLMTLDKD